jgi:thiamine-monophosphate kinase
MAETLSDVGEFGLIGRLRDLILKEGCSSAGLRLGIGDDTASFTPRRGHEILITCDSMVEGRHYLPDRITPRDLGRRAMTSNISDIGAMGGDPLYALVSLGLKADMTVSVIEEIYRGFLYELNPFRASIIGGNITGVGDRTFIDITLVGEVRLGGAVRRSTARPGDSILVTGFPGQSAAGLQLLLGCGKGGALESHPLVRKYLVPGHRAVAGREVGLSGLATAMIDTSDGLVGDLGHICEGSGAGADLDAMRLPVSDDLLEASRDLGRDPLDFVLGWSDDYELIITCAPRHVDKLVAVLMQAGVESVSEVGRLTSQAQNIRIIGEDGRARRLNPSGWDHFGGRP